MAGQPFPQDMACSFGTDMTFKWYDVSYQAGSFEFDAA